MKREQLFELAVVVVIVAMLGALIFGLMLGVLSFAGITYQTKGALVAFIGLVTVIDIVTYLPFRLIGRLVSNRVIVIWYFVENVLTIAVADYFMATIELTPLTLMVVGLIFAAFEYVLSDKKTVTEPE